VSDTCSALHVVVLPCLIACPLALAQILTCEFACAQDSLETPLPDPRCRTPLSDSAVGPAVGPRCRNSCCRTLTLCCLTPLSAVGPAGVLFGSISYNKLAMDVNIRMLGCIHNVSIVWVSPWGQVDRGLRCVPIIQHCTLTLKCHEDELSPLPSSSLYNILLRNAVRVSMFEHRYAYPTPYGAGTPAHSLSGYALAAP